MERFPKVPKGTSQPSSDGYDVQISYRTLSVRIDDQEPTSKPTSKPSKDSTEGLVNIDVHLISSEEVFTRYSSHPSVGLEFEAVTRRAKGGKNVFSPPRTQYWKKIINYIFGGFNFLMWIAFILSLLSYEPLGAPSPAVFNLGVAVLLILVIIVSATFYAFVDWNASRIMKSIKSLVAQEAVVIRDSKQQVIPASDVVVGDVVQLSTGDRVPADLRLVQVTPDLRFDRSLFTGESDMVPGAVDATSDNVLETRNLALTSTFVVQGTCTGVVFATGDRTVMGRIVSMSGDTKFKMTTIQREVWFFTKIISGLALSLFGISILLWGVWLRTSFPGYETSSGAIINSIGCLTSFVPQGLPVCVALSLTVVARRMAKRHVLVKNLATIETLGCMSVLCSDKTGTLTAGEMSIEDVAFFDGSLRVGDISKVVSSASQPGRFSALKALHMVARLCNGAKFNAASENLPIEEPTVKGDPTDSAVLRFSQSLSIPSLDVDTTALLSSWKKTFEIPFNSRNKWMLTVVNHCQESGEKGSEPWLLVKGAPDVLFPSCESIMNTDGTIVPFGNDARRGISALQNEWSDQGQRVLALCRKQLDGIKTNVSPNDMEEMMYAEVQGLTLVGIIGIRDPPRADVPSAIVTIRRAGVRVFMVTGDFKLTAVAIAHHLDTISNIRVSDYSKEFSVVPLSAVKPSEDDPIRSLVLTGDDVASLSPEDWNIIVGRYTEIVFARTTPDQKLRIVEEIKARGDNTVAVTGDGVNDAPALKASDIGVAMGSGSDVAKEAASLILLNNDFSSIPVAIEMGRLVFDNLKKVILYLTPAGSYAEFMAVLGTVFFGMQIPMSSYLQVCFCITNDVVMSISLMYEKPEADLMLRKPRNARTDRLSDWRFFVQVYFVRGFLPCMWFLYMHQHGLSFYDVILVYNKWTDGWKGHSTSDLTQLVNVGQCIYYVTIVFMQCGSLLSVRNRRVSILNSNPLWGPRRNLVVPLGMIGTALIAVVNLYGPGLNSVFGTAPIPRMFWGLPFCFALGVLIMDEIRKAIVRNYPKSIIAAMAW
ncbi:hypothetical protein SERLA73DRAFT_165832 [Serpula lacrymans var. lacrymans S7.3]|uniref:Cation-transporting P-type ATPase N-terminal domain-containing protein n=1 Tax=Serpula lacrymans var. lacrymans (strain S7.3) TaxID=936435 RepID=F8PMS3_SERL3|nr:hypothetical protein SERLA73DRAFT_165832 [Serpula lacrymans var. lacrymans S7.3]